MRLYLLDGLRGLAALAVVVWHWQHLYFIRWQPFDPRVQPYYEILAPIYRHGAYAVDLFFCLSGFVFHWLYASSIAERKISGREFFLLRFSRLYPLHLATLVTVAGAFAAYGPFIYRGTVGDFALELVLASSIVREKTYTFNGPAWSISIETFLYLVFFLTCRWVPWRLVTCVAGIVAGATLWHVNEEVARGLASFFAGGAVYLAYGWALRHARALNVAAGLLWVATLAQFYLAVLPLSPYVTRPWLVLVLFPLTVLALAVAQAPDWARRPAAFLGDISYSVYLLHFPLQIVVVLLAIPPDTPFALPVFMLVTVLVAAASNIGFERPAREWLRSLGALSRYAGTSARALASAPRDR